MCNSNPQLLTFKFGIHNDAVKLYIIEKETGKRKNKSLSTFWGKTYKLQTNIEYWNKTNERFIEEIPSNLKKGKAIPIITAIEDNKRLTELKKQLEELASTIQCSSIESFLNCWEAAKNIEASKEFTLVGYSEYLYKLKEKGEEDIVRTTNYQLYKKFFYKLQGKIKGKTMDWANEIAKFAEMPISQINDEVYQKFALFCVNNKISKETIRYFYHVVYHYQHETCKNNGFRFNLKAITEITKNYQKTNEHTAIALTQKQWKEFLAVDLREVFPNANAKIMGLKQLYYDTLLLLYYTASRPIDVISMKIEDVEYDDEENILCWEYSAHKLKNLHARDGIETPQIPLPPETMDIIKKYKGNRKKGYLLPFTCNLNNAITCRSQQTNHYSTDMGCLLQAIAKHYNWKQKEGKVFTAYSIRKTRLTHMKGENMDYDNIAYIAQTSEKELRKVYVDRKSIAKKQMKEICYSKKTAV